MRLLALLAVATLVFGQSVPDPYRYLEDAGSARTQQWIDAQNVKADRVLGAYSGGAQLARRVRALAHTGEQRYGAQLAGKTLFFMRETPPQPQPVLVAQDWPQGTPRVLLDPAALGPAVSIDFVWPSPDGRLLAIGTSSGGSESTTIRVLDVSGARIYAEALGPAGGGTTDPVVAWDADGRAFTYGRLPAGGSQFGIKLYHHVVGTAQSSDALSLDALSPIAEYQLVTSAGARQAAALVKFGDGSFYRVYRRDGTTWHSLAGAQAGITEGAFAGNRLARRSDVRFAARAHRGAPRRRNARYDRRRGTGLGAACDRAHQRRLPRHEVVGNALARGSLRRRRPHDSHARPALRRHRHRRHRFG